MDKCWREFTTLLYNLSLLQILLAITWNGLSPEMRDDNKIIITGIFPDNLKLATIMLLHKKADKMIITNDMPISLLPSISNIIEKHIIK